MSVAGPEVRFHSVDFFIRRPPRKKSNKSLRSIFHLDSFATSAMGFRRQVFSAAALTDASTYHGFQVAHYDDLVCTSL